MFAFTAIDPEDGVEGVCGADIPGLGMTALVGADMQRVESLRPIAQAIARQHGTAVKLSVFTTREDIEVIEP